MVQGFIDGVIAKERLSPSDESTLNKMISNLHIKINFKNNKGLQKYKFLWQLDNGQLQSIPSPFSLQHGECLYYTTKVFWYEERTRTAYTTYSALTSSVRIAKGLFYRWGAITPNRHTEEYVKCIDRGDIFLTNKRVIFIGQHGNKSMLLSKILFVTPYSNGVELERESGKKPFLECADKSDAEILNAFITRLIQ